MYLLYGHTVLDVSAASFTPVLKFLRYFAVCDCVRHTCSEHALQVPVWTTTDGPSCSRQQLNKLP